MILHSTLFHLFKDFGIYIRYFVGVIFCLGTLNPLRERNPEIPGGFTALRGVRFVDNHGEGLAFEFAHLLGNHAELLNR